MQSDRSFYFSKKVTFLNTFMTFLIVILHAKTPERWGLPLDMRYPFIYLVNAFTQVGVPMFFFISGLLFYRNCTFSEIERKLHSRVHSLLVPYIIWNTLFVGIFFFLTHIPFFHDKMNAGNVLDDPLEIINAILNARYSVLWFVKDLMIFCLLSAGIFLTLKNRTAAFTILILSIMNVLLSNYSYENIFTWFPIYFSGAIMGKYYSGENHSYCSITSYMKNKVQRYCTITILTIGFVCLYVVAIYKPEGVFIFRLISPIILWYLTDLLLEHFLNKRFHTKVWMSYTFFIFCTHHFLLNVIQKMVVLTCPPTPLVLNVTYIISPIVVVGILIITAKFLSRYKFYTYLSGGR